MRLWSFTKHVALVILLPSFLTHIAGDTQKDDHVVLGGVMVRLQSAEDKKSFALVQRKCDSRQSLVEGWQREIILRDQISIQPETCSKLIFSTRGLERGYQIRKQI
jgi:hypothetical protein